MVTMSDRTILLTFIMIQRQHTSTLAFKNLYVRYRNLVLQNTSIKATQSKLPARSKMQDHLNENSDTKGSLRQRETSHGL